MDIPMTFLDPSVTGKSAKGYSTFSSVNLNGIDDAGGFPLTAKMTTTATEGPILYTSQSVTNFDARIHRILYRPRETRLWLILFLISITNSICLLYDILFISYLGSERVLCSLVLFVSLVFILTTSILWFCIRTCLAPTTVPETDIGQKTCWGGKREIVLQVVCLGAMVLYWGLNVYGDKSREWFPWKSLESKMVYYTVVCITSTLGLYFWVGNTPVVAKWDTEEIASGIETGGAIL